jgi:hypothetical protein
MARWACRSASRRGGEPLCLWGPNFGIWISIIFLKTHLDRRRAAAGARVKPAQPVRRVLRPADHCGSRRFGGTTHIKSTLVLTEVERAAFHPSRRAGDEPCRRDAYARRSTARPAAPDHHRTGIPSCLAPQSASSTGANRSAAAQSPHVVPARPLEQCVRLLWGCWPRARTREAWCPQASGQAAGAAHAANAGCCRCGSVMVVPAGPAGAPFRRRHSSRCPSAGRSLLSSAPPTRVAATCGSRRPSIRIRSSCCASGSPAAAISSEPHLAACRRCAGQGRASARLDPCAARTPAGTVVAVVRGRVTRNIAR